MVRRALLLLLCLACGACAAILGFERLSEEGRFPDSGPDITDAPSEAPGDPACVTVGVPDRPADAGGGDGGNALHFAFSVFDLGIDSTAAVPGYNLDLACSPSVATSTCQTNADPSTFDEYVRDKERGIDNAGFALLQYVVSINASEFGPEAINTRLREGQFGMVMRMTEWNGEADDDSVRLELFPALRVTNADGGTSPGFGSGDVWVRDDRFRVATDASRFISVRAWTKGRVLTGFFTDVSLPITVTGDDKRFDIILREAWFTARIDGSGQSLRLVEGTAAARWKTADFLGEVRMIKTNDFSVCESPARDFLYEPAKQKLCAGRDIHALSVDDGKPTPCGAISVGARFEAYGVDTLGPFELEEPFSFRCQDGGVPLGDDCP